MEQKKYLSFFLFSFLREKEKEIFFYFFKFIN